MVIHKLEWIECWITVIVSYSKFEISLSHSKNSDFTLKACFGSSLLYIHLISQTYSAIILKMGQLKINIWMPINSVCSCSQGSKDKQGCVCPAGILCLRCVISDTAPQKWKRSSFVHLKLPVDTDWEEWWPSHSVVNAHSLRTNSQARNCNAAHGH